MKNESMMDYLEARLYLQDVRLKFDKTMDVKMKQALERADEALAIVHEENKNIMYISPNIKKFPVVNEVEENGENL